MTGFIGWPATASAAGASGDDTTVAVSSFKKLEGAAVSMAAESGEAGSGTVPAAGTSCLEASLAVSGTVAAGLASAVEGAGDEGFVSACRGFASADWSAARVICPASAIICLSSTFIVLVDEEEAGAVTARRAAGSGAGERHHRPGHVQERK